MTATNRRQVLKTVGASAGAGGLGVSAVSSGSADADSTQTAEITNVMSVRGTEDGLLAVSEPSIQKARENGINLPGSEERPLVELSANVYSDGTWESTNVNFADIPIEELVGQDMIDQYNPIVSGDITEIPVEIRVPNGLSGQVQFGNDSPLLSFEGTVTLYVGFSEEFPDQQDLLHDIYLSNTTTEQSGVMVGNADFSTSSGTATLVDNEFRVSKTNRTIFGGVLDIDNELNLPSDPGKSWLELPVDVEFDDYIAQPPAIVGDTPPKRSGIDNRWDIITGQGSCPSILDVQTLFSNLDNPDIQNNVEAFNFSASQSDRVTVFDVQALYSRMC